MNGDKLLNAAAHSCSQTNKQTNEQTDLNGEEYRDDGKGMGTGMGLKLVLGYSLLHTHTRMQMAVILRPVQAT